MLNITNSFVTLPTKLLIERKKSYLEFHAQSSYLKIIQSELYKMKVFGKTDNKLQDNLSSLQQINNFFINFEQLLTIPHKFFNHYGSKKSPR